MQLLPSLSINRTSQLGFWTQGGRIKNWPGCGYPIPILALTCTCFLLPCPPIDSVMRLMTVWRITGKII